MITYHSQHVTGQDRWVIETLNGRRNGVFVEVGAHDGRRHSNTLTLEESFGWTGLLIEPNPELYLAMRENRPRCRHSALAISNEPGVAQFVCGDAYGGLLRYMPADWKLEHAARGNPIRRTKTGRLYPLLSGVFPTLSIIDYLSIDTEGSEYAILADYFGRTHKPIRCLTVEFRYDGVLLQQLEDLLSHHGYVLDCVRAFDACFLNPRLL